MKVQTIKTKDLHPNTGQVAGLPKNPRFIKDDKFEKLVNSLREDPEMMQLREVIAYDNHGELVVICGNMRLRAAKELGLKEVPCKVLPSDTDVEKLKAYTIKDNSEFGENDWDLLNQEWDIDQLQDWGVDVPFVTETDAWSEDENCNARIETEDEGIQPDKDNDFFYFSKDQIKAQIVKEWKPYECLQAFVDDIIDEPTAMYQYNRLCQGYKSGYNISLLFNPHRLTTPTHKTVSLFEHYQTNDKFKEGFARFMIETQNKCTPKCQYNKFLGIGIAGSQYINEFQPYLARDIYKRYVKDGDRVLNPCAGWGGRLLGISSCRFKNIEYVETDPSTLTYQGLVKMKNWLHLGDNYKQYNLPFEELNLQDNYFDFVFTSPPYFDTERYSDEDTQSWKKNNNYTAWKVNFLYVMIDKILQCMKKTGICILNVGNKKYPISNDINSYLKTKYQIETQLADFTLDNSSDGIRQADEDFIMFHK